MEARRYRTVPKELVNHPELLPTGNQFVALPDLSPEQGAVLSLNVVSWTHNGLLEVRGGPGGRRGSLGRVDPGPLPLFRPYVEVDGRELGLEGRLRWRRLNAWIPSFDFDSEPVGAGDQAIRVSGILCAPPGQKGFVYGLRVHNASSRSLEVLVGLEGCSGVAHLRVFTARPLTVAGPAGPETLRPSMRWDSWTQSLVTEFRAPLPVVAWAVGTDEVPEVLEFGPAHAAPGGPPTSLRIGRRLAIEPGGEVAVPFYVAVAAEEDSARTTVVHLRRVGFEALVDQSLQWLERRLWRAPASRTPAAGPSSGASAPTRVALSPVEERVNLNLFFSLFFATATTIDTEETVALTARSPYYYVCGAFWSRDALLWSLPGLILVDPARAREVVLYAFRRQSANMGCHATYLNGTTLYPGFELDELAAFPVALASYMKATGDRSLLKEPEVRAGLLRFVRLLQEVWPEGDPLAPTFLDPSDDPVEQPWLTYDNALLWRALAEAAFALGPLGHRAEADWCAARAKRLERAIRERCVVEGPFGPQFAWAVGPSGAPQLYDDPPGSLRLLPHIGFCSPTNPAYANTLRWIASPHNPYGPEPGPFGEARCVHSPFSWPMAACNTILGALTAETGRPLEPQLRPAVEAAVAYLAGAKLDAGIACETVHSDDGRARTGAAFASFAGLLGYALARGVEALALTAAPGGS